MKTEHESATQKHTKKHSIDGDFTDIVTSVNGLSEHHILLKMKVYLFVG